jgi:ABC-type bacteriocin/lantibiotic exporter with double-glycine peptidase domain
LRVLGIRAEEGALALLAGTSPATGTPPQTLARVLNEQFGPSGLHPELRGFRSVAELTEKEFPMLVLVRFSFLLDHWLVVTGRTKNGFAVGDPLSGRIELTAAELEGRWRRVAIVLHRSLR